MARTKASRLSQAGTRGVDAGVGDTTRSAREGAAFPPPEQEPSEGESLARACPETPSTSDSPPAQPPASADRASDDDARVARAPRDAFAALVAPRATRRAPVRDRPTDNLPGVHAASAPPDDASGTPALARQAPRAEPRVEAPPKARTVRFSRHVHGTSRRPRAPAPARPRAPFGTLPSASHSSDAPRRRRRFRHDPPSHETRRDPPVEHDITTRARSLAVACSILRASFFSSPPASRVSLPGQVSVSPKPSARCW